MSKKKKLKEVIQLNAAELQSHSTRVDWAEGLISQLPEGHEGKLSWLLNYGKGKEAKKLRKKAGLKFDKKTQSTVLEILQLKVSNPNNLKAEMSCRDHFTDSIAMAIERMNQLSKSPLFPYGKAMKSQEVSLSEEDKETLERLFKEEREEIKGFDFHTPRTLVSIHGDGLVVLLTLFAEPAYKDTFSAIVLEPGRSPFKLGEARTDWSIESFQDCNLEVEVDTKFSERVAHDVGCMKDMAKTSSNLGDELRKATDPEMMGTDFSQMGGRFSDNFANESSITQGPGPGDQRDPGDECQGKGDFHGSLSKKDGEGL